MEGGLGFLAAGYAVAFLALIVYVVSIARRQRKLEEQLDRLQAPESTND